ncbi:MAG: hypothetical protein KTR31_28405 [Myxococcales bacterium]|nr:hypothetical protein [Myxococcales bacterium]
MLQFLAMASLVACGPNSETNTSTATTNTTSDDPDPTTDTEDTPLDTGTDTGTPSTTTGDTSTVPPFDCSLIAGKVADPPSHLPPALQGIVDGTLKVQAPVEGVTFDTTCKYALDEHYLPNVDAVATRVFEVYESYTKAIDVHIEPAEPTVVVLLSYEPLDWTVTEAAPGSITTIYTASYEPGTVSAPEGVSVIDLKAVIAKQKKKGYAKLAGGGWYTDPTATLHTELDGLGYTIDSYVGCYAADSIIARSAAVPNVTESAPSCTPGPSPAAPDSTWAAAQCPALGGGPICATATYNNISLFDVSSGSSCPVAATYHPFGLLFSSRGAIGWSGQELFACSDAGFLVRIDMDAGTHETTYARCEGVAVTECGLFLRSPFGQGELLTQYPSFEEAKCGINGVSHGQLDQVAFDVRGDLVVHPDWFSTDTFQWRSIGASVAPPDLVTNGKGWVDGVYLHSSGTELYWLNREEISVVDSTGLVTPTSNLNTFGADGMDCDGP